MMHNDKLVLLLNVRLSEREPTGQGRRLDRIVGLPQSRQTTLKNVIIVAAIGAVPVDMQQCTPARFTAIMRNQFGAVFNLLSSQGGGLGQFPFGGLPGFYLVDPLSLAGNDKILRDEGRAYLLSHQGNVAGMRFALLKNRAKPGSPVLPVFFGLLRKFRLGEQFSNLSFLSEEMQKATQTRESCLANNRLQKIELILFLSAILGLGVGLNAIQMPPFFDAGATKVLLSLTFWIAFGGVIGGSLLIWGGPENWKWARRWGARILDKVTRRETK